jgi:hypothetical protein
MREIQVDMFEVQLGLSMLLQFKLSNGSLVRVLCDGGIKAHGYPASHVNSKLPAACAALGPFAGQLDLVVGTHYDADHLDGLVPVVNDPANTIGEIWLPPVAAIAPSTEDGVELDEDDTEDEDEEDEDAVSDGLMVGRLMRAGGNEYLAELLEGYRQVVEGLDWQRREIESLIAGEPVQPEEGGETSPRYPEKPREATTELWDEFFDQTRSFFEWHLRLAEEEEPPAERPDAEVVLGPSSFDPGVPFTAKGPLMGTGSSEVADLADLKTQGEYARASLRTNSAFYGPAKQWLLAIVGARAAVSTTAIAGTSLRTLVAAVKARGIPIRCHVIPFGSPQTFAWDGSAFRVGATPVDGLELVQLGPSATLVAKHRRLLPAISYLLRFAAIAIKSITPSNQLSYTLRFKFDGQGILVVGDAGCNDFKRSGRSPYEPALLAEIVPSHVVQVAHHGGANAHFYRVLLAAGYDTRQTDSHLLLSHATHDKHRPSKAFDLFYRGLTASHPRVLFTSEPDKAKVAPPPTCSYYPYVAPVTPASTAPASAGDIRLHYTSATWTVQSHAVKV